MVMEAVMILRLSEPSWSEAKRQLGKTVGVCVCLMTSLRCVTCDVFVKVCRVAGLLTRYCCMCPVLYNVTLENSTSNVLHDCTLMISFIIQPLPLLLVDVTNACKCDALWCWEIIARLCSL